jgi:hypothetical protein
VFGAEIGAVREARSQVDGVMGVDVALAPFLVPSAAERLRYVLEDVLADWTEPTEADLHAAARATVEVLGANLARIDALLGGPTTEIVAEPGAGDDVMYVLGCADRYHLDPRVVLDWPVGLFLDVVDAFSGPPEKPQDRTASEAFIGSILPTITPEEAGMTVGE